MRAHCVCVNGCVNVYVLVGVIVRDGSATHTFRYAACMRLCERALVLACMTVSVRV
jgi:hypothetical protein